MQKDCEYPDCGCDPRHCFAEHGLDMRSSAERVAEFKSRTYGIDPAAIKGEPSFPRSADKLEGRS